MTAQGLLLDTCAIIWAFGDGELADRAIEEIEAAAGAGELFVSPISAWELGQLMRKGRLALTKPPELWFDDVLSSPGVRLAPMTTSVLIASSFLPGDPPNEPADRIIASTCRSEGLVLVTRDAKLLRYAERGHIRALAC